MSPTGDLLVTPIFRRGDAALSLLRHSHVLHWHGTLSGAAHPLQGNVPELTNTAQGDSREGRKSHEESIQAVYRQPTDKLRTTVRRLATDWESRRLAADTPKTKTVKFSGGHETIRKSSKLPIM